MSSPAYNEIIEAVCKDYGLTLVDAAVEGVSELAGVFNIDPSRLKGQSYCIGGTEIVLGAYESEEIRVAAFFHEVGHILSNLDHNNNNWSQLLVESLAWKLGVMLAAKYGLCQWNKEVGEYVMASLASYELGALGPIDDFD